MARETGRGQADWAWPGRDLEWKPLGLVDHPKDFGFYSEGSEEPWKVLNYICPDPLAAVKQRSVRGLLVAMLQGAHGGDLDQGSVEVGRTGQIPGAGST